MRPIRLMLVDDHEIVRRGIAALLGGDARFSIVAEAQDGEEALTRLSAVEIDVVVLDLAMPRVNGIEAIRRILEKFPKLKIVVLSMHDDDQIIAQALDDGASAYVRKESGTEELAGAIEKAMQGERTLQAGVKTEPDKRTDGKNPDLTDREREVLRLILDGRTTRDIAELLAISPHTATHHRANLMRKLEVHSQIELVRAAFRLRLAGLSKRPHKL